MNVSHLEKQLDMKFNNENLIKQAFIHSSYVNEHRKQSHLDNERLEFLGDAVLELAVSQYLYRKHHKMSEGELSKLRASIVCEPSLAHFAEELQLGKYILLGKGEERTGGRTRPSLLADVFESFLGALYLDLGFDTVLHFLNEYIFPMFNQGAFSHAMDYKSALQERVQQYDDFKINYHIVEESGPSHYKKFIAEVYINNDVYRGDVGRTKKESEQRAAKRALDRFDRNKLL